MRQSQRPQRLGQTTFECLSVSCEVRVSSGLLQRQGLWLQQTWEQTTRHEAWVLLEEVTIAHHRAIKQTHKLQNYYTRENLALLKKFKDPQQISQPGDLANGLRTPWEFDFRGQWDLTTELLQDWGKRHLEDTNKTLCAPGPRRKEQWPHQTDPDLAVSVQESPEEAWVDSGLLRGQGHWIQQCRHKSFLKEAAITAITPTTVCLRPNNREGTQSHPQEKIG